MSTTGGRTKQYYSVSPNKSMFPLTLIEAFDPINAARLYFYDLYRGTSSDKSGVKVIYVEDTYDVPTQHKLTMNVRIAPSGNVRVEEVGV